MVKGRRLFKTETGTQLDGDFSFFPDGTCVFRDGRTVITGRMVYIGLSLRFEVERCEGSELIGPGTVFVGGFVR